MPHGPRYPGLNLGAERGRILQRIVDGNSGSIHVVTDNQRVPDGPLSETWCPCFLSLIIRTQAQTKVHFVIVTKHKAM